MKVCETVKHRKWGGTCEARVMPMRFQASDPAVGGSDHRFGRVFGRQSATPWRGVRSDGDLHEMARTAAVKHYSLEGALV